MKNNIITFGKIAFISSLITVPVFVFAQVPDTADQGTTVVAESTSPATVDQGNSSLTTSVPATVDQGNSSTNNGGVPATVDQGNSGSNGGGVPATEDQGNSGTRSGSTNSSSNSSSHSSSNGNGHAVGSKTTLKATTTLIAFVNGTNCSYISNFMKFGGENSKVDVSKLQGFLNEELGTNLDVNGVYDSATQNAVSLFQLRYSNDTLKPWGASLPSGDVFVTTLKKINEIFCRRPRAFTGTELSQFENYKKGIFVASNISNEGVYSNNPTYTITKAEPTTTIEMKETRTASVFSSIGSGIKSFFKGIFHFFSR